MLRCSSELLLHFFDINVRFDHTPFHQQVSDLKWAVNNHSSILINLRFSYFGILHFYFAGFVLSYLDISWFHPLALSIKIFWMRIIIIMYI